MLGLGGGSGGPELRACEGGVGEGVSWGKTPMEDREESTWPCSDSAAAAAADRS